MTEFLRLIPWALCAALAAGVLVLLTAQRASAQETTADRNRALVAAGFEAWAGAVGSPYDLLADDAVWTITGNSLGAGTYESKEAFLAGVIRPFNARMREPLVPTVRRLYAEDDTVIAHFDAHGIARDGGPYINSYAWILQMQDGRIVKAHAFFDSIAFDDLWRRVSPDPAP